MKGRSKASSSATLTQEIEGTVARHEERFEDLP